MAERTVQTVVVTTYKGAASEATSPGKGSPIEASDVRPAKIVFGTFARVIIAE